MLCIRSGFFLHRAAVIGGLRRGTGSLVRCAFASFFLALCSYSQPSPLSPFCVHRLRRGGGERGTACSYGTRVPAREGRSARTASELPGLSLAGQGPPVLPTPSACSLSLPGVAFVFPFRSLRPVSVSLFAAPCGAFRRESLPPPMRCVAPRSARCLPRHFSLPSVRSIFPAPLPFSSPPCFAPCPPRRRFRHPRFAR